MFILTGTYIAMVSTSAIDVKDRFNANNTTIRNSNGDLVANDEADLFDGTILTSLSYDEFSDNSAGSVDVWTGSLHPGTGSAGQLCADWSSNLAGDDGRYGISGSFIVFGQWITTSTQGCHLPKHLYCISTTPQP